MHGNSCAAGRETGMGTAVQPAERQAWEQLCSRQRDRHGNSCAAGRETDMGTAVQPAERQAWEQLCSRQRDRLGNSCAAGDLKLKQIGADELAPSPTEQQQQQQHQHLLSPAPLLTQPPAELELVSLLLLGETARTPTARSDDHY